MIEKIKQDHESFRTTTQPITTNYSEHMSEKEGTIKYSEFNADTNKTIVDMQKMIHTQNNIDEGISKEVSTLYTMIKDLEKKLINLSNTTPPPSVELQTRNSKNAIEDIRTIKAELRTIKENAARDKINTYEVLDNLNDVVVELRKDKLIKVRSILINSGTFINQRTFLCLL